jgi:hypothetical protein
VILPVKGRRAGGAPCDSGRMNVPNEPAQHEPTQNEPTQNEPIESGHDDAGIGQKIAGIAVQMRGDADLGHVDELRSMARQRLEDAGLPSDGVTIDRVLAAVRSV